jgi:hypothetical protein
MPHISGVIFKCRCCLKKVPKGEELFNVCVETPDISVVFSNGVVKKASFCPDCYKRTVDNITPGPEGYLIADLKKEFAKEAEEQARLEGCNA